MSRRRFSTVASLVADLLDRHERTPDARNLIASIDDDGFANVDLRDSFDEELAALEREGGVEYIRRGLKTERVVVGVRLKNAELLYRRCGRRPARQLATEAVSELRRRWHDLPDGASCLIDEAVEAWGRGVSHIGVAVGDVRTLGQVIELAVAVQRRMLGAPVDEQDLRTFSRLTVGDSKALERNIGQVASAIRKIFPADEEQAHLDPEELLFSVGVKRLPQPILIHGAVSLDGRPFPEMPYVGVPADCADDLGVLSKPDYVLTIENFTSFVRHVREVATSERALVIYAGGFPSRSTLATILRLASQADAPTFHWGDMDAGGVRIFRHLERCLDAVGICLRPHMMDAERLRGVGAPAPRRGRPIGDLGGSALAELANLISETGLVHEQEAFDPQSPLAGALISRRPTVLGI